MNAFGYWPSFHDARVVKIRIEGGTISFTLRAFEMTTQTDEHCYFRLTKHHDVRLRFDDVVESELSARDDSLMRLVIEDELDGDGRFRVDMESDLGGDYGGSFRARSGDVVEVVASLTTPCASGA